MIAKDNTRYIKKVFKTLDYLLTYFDMMPELFLCAMTDDDLALEEKEAQIFEHWKELAFKKAKMRERIANQIKKGGANESKKSGNF
jgi:hypothetical protein